MNRFSISPESIKRTACLFASREYWRQQAAKSHVTQWYNTFMSTIVKMMSPDQIDRFYLKLKGRAEEKKTPQYAKWAVKIQGITVTAWNSGKVVFQGEDMDWLVDSAQGDIAPAKKKSAPASSNSVSPVPSVSISRNHAHDIFPQAGSDEVGTGDYIGPVVVAAVIVPDKETADKLHALAITDSKAMTDTYIMKIAPQIEKMVPNSILVMQNPLYNDVHDRRNYNMNKIKAMLHNQAYLNLEKKGYVLPDLCMIDQFCQPKTFYSYLTQEKRITPNLKFQTKAESSWIAVAAASVLARWRFLQTWELLEEKYGMKLAKGGGAKATESAKKLLAKIGKDRMNEVVKIHFANSRKIGLLPDLSD